MTRKGGIEEIFSKALFAYRPDLYRIFYGGFERINELALPEFSVESDYFQTIPVNRIKKIKLNSTILFERNMQGIEDSWEFLKKSRPFKTKWQKRKSTKQQSTT